MPKEMFYVTLEIKPTKSVAMGTRRQKICLIQFNNLASAKIWRMRKNSREKFTRILFID